MWGQTLATGVRETMPNPTVNNYTAGDGERFWLVGLEGDRHWPALLRAIDRIEWLDDERFLTRPERAINARELVAALDAILATPPRAESNGRAHVPNHVTTSPRVSRLRT